MSTQCRNAACATSSPSLRQALSPRTITRPFPSRLLPCPRGTCALLSRSRRRLAPTRFDERAFFTWAISSLATAPPRSTAYFLPPTLSLHLHLHLHKHKHQKPLDFSPRRRLSDTCTTCTLPVQPTLRRLHLLAPSRRSLAIPPQPPTQHAFLDSPRCT